jgi:hypothetical protein
MAEYEITYHPERTATGHDPYDVLRDGRWLSSEPTREDAEQMVAAQQRMDEQDATN